MKLTAVIICRSRRDKGFERALESVGFADEILVEERPEIADYAAVRNEALKKARGEWVVFVDSDEEVSDELKKEIQEITDKDYKDYKNYNISGAYFRRVDRFLGKWLRHGEAASVRLLRLGRRDAGRWERSVHEVWKVKGKVRELKQPIWHYSHRTVLEMVEKLDRYSEMEAEYRARQRDKWKNKINRLIDKQTNGRIDKWIICFQLVFLPAGKFIQNYIFRLGFLDGMEGFIHAFLMSGHSFLVRAKLVHKNLKYQIL